MIIKKPSSWDESFVDGVYVQIKAVLNCYYKVFKEESVLIFSCHENAQYYWNKLREILHLKLPPTETTKDPEATLPPVITYLLYTRTHVVDISVIFCGLRPVSADVG